ncbi:hypothetical protein GCM10027056_12830 [Glaciibacter psychrotolerans]
MPCRPQRLNDTGADIRSTPKGCVRIDRHGESEGGNRHKGEYGGLCTPNRPIHQRVLHGPRKKG